MFKISSNDRLRRMIECSQNPTWTKRIVIEGDINWGGEDMSNNNPHIAVYEKGTDRLVAYGTWSLENPLGVINARVRLETQHPSYDWIAHVEGAHVSMEGIRKRKREPRRRSVTSLDFTVTSNHEAVLRDLEKLNALIEKINATPIEAEITLE